MTEPIHIPVLRGGESYSSLDRAELTSPRDGRVLASVSQANAGLIRRDLRKIHERAAVLRAIPTRDLLEICKRAGELFMTASLPIDDDGPAQGPDDYVALLSETSGLPHTLCRRNMNKVRTVFDEMEGILAGLMRGMDLSVVDTGFGEHCGVRVCYYETTDALGVVLPSNSPGVNSIWMPALALRTPVVLKPGREEPWTPLRIIRALMAAGCPKEAFHFYPTDHEGSATILQGCGRALLFGDEKTTAAYAGDPRINLHGPGRSKIVVGEDMIDDWREWFDVLVASVVDNGGRSCINASTIIVPRHADEIADALAEAVVSIEPKESSDPDARLSVFANPKFAEWIDATIDAGIEAGGAVDLTLEKRGTPRRLELGGSQYLRPTIVRCQSIDHPLARTEFLFPFTSVLEAPQASMLDALGPTLVLTAITRDRDWIRELVRSHSVDRLNLGPYPTSRAEWDQPHEGNLFEFLYARRAIQGGAEC
ncbi:MAG: aldehyde dehydrogenase [Planctomycetes bacterium]|nr:aldehyde dehydrogenase [Planctomycetota bacterium]